MLLRDALLGPLLVLVLAPLGCAPDAGGGPVEPLGEASGSDEELQGDVPAQVFYRSDQISFGRAPSSADTHDASKEIDPNFQSPEAAADKVIAWVEAHKDFDKPIYIGCIHAWLYDTDAGYRERIATLASRLDAKIANKILFYFEERNASHTPHAVRASLAPALTTLATHAVLLCATYVNGAMSEDEQRTAVIYWKRYYNQKLGVPMTSLWVDIDTSQTPSGQYYGSRGDLAKFNARIGGAVRSAYAHGFGGFHTYGNVGGQFGTQRAADSTYDALNAAWTKLATDHPKQTFFGM